MGASPYRYIEREWDGTDGLNYHRARYYDPTIGRFLSRDPAGMVDGTNLYVYAGDNPVSYSDPSGNYRPGTPGPIRYQPSGFYCPSCPTYSPQPSRTPPFWQSQYCMAEDALFAIMLGLSLLGLSFDSAKLLRLAAAVAFTGGVLDLVVLFRNTLDNPAAFVNFASAFINFMWALITGYIIPQANNMWEQMMLAADIGAQGTILFTPPGLLAKAAMIGIVGGLGFTALELKGCGIPIPH